jgi:hypothetical protein
VPADFVRTEEEDALAGQYSLDDEQLTWRRRKVLELDELFPQEYPLTAEEAFVTSVGFGVFDLEWLLRRREELPEPLEQDDGTGRLVRELRPGMHGFGGTLRRWEWPDAEARYAIWVDPHGGRTGDDLDWTSAHVINLSTGNMAAHYHAQCDAQQAANDLNALSMEYWSFGGRGQQVPALIGVLSTGVGAAILLALQQLGAPLWGELRSRKVNGRSITTTEYGFPAAREHLFDEALKEACRIWATGGAARMILNDVDTLDEMSHYVYLPNGKRGGEENWHDDRVRSWGACVWYVSTLPTEGMRTESRRRAEERRERLEETSTLWPERAGI